jgi:hypothetical protein
MAQGMNVRWEVGERESIVQPGGKGGAMIPRLGKNQGPVFKQRVVKVYEPATK